MEKSTDATKKIIVHEFYCDNCNAKIGETEEWDDGYYEVLGEFEIEARIDRSTEYRLSKQLCAECRNKLINKITEVFTKYDFKENKINW